MLPSVLEEEIVVPFSLHDPYYALWEVKGLAKASEKGLFLEFEVKEINVSTGTLNFSQEVAVREIMLPFDQIEEISFKTSVLFSKLIVKTKSLKALSDLPGNHTEGTKLGISRGNREKAQRLVSTLRMYQSEKQLKEAEARLDAVSED